MSIGESGLLKFEGAIKKFAERGRSFRSRRKEIYAMDHVDLEVRKGEVLGLVGESGSGKTTLGLAALRLVELSGGQVVFDGKNVNKLKGKDMMKFRADTQMIFQDPFESLNPLMNVFKIVSTPLEVFHKEMSHEDKVHLVSEHLELAGLFPAHDFLYKSPTQLSGGQRQRVGVARAMINQPKFIVADEPVSMLDVSLRADMLNLLRDINVKEHTTMLFISHDIIATKYVSDRIAVMHLGQIVEVAPSKELMKNPMHPYTKVLLESVPDLGREKNEKGEMKVEYTRDIKNQGENACSFYHKCPFAMDKCKESRPPLVTKSQEHYVACYLY